MVRPFSQFLREQEAKAKEEAQANEAVISEWREAVERLFDQVRGWLNTSDPDGILKIQQKDHEANEPILGRYVVPRLDLRGLGKWIGIIPKARKTVGTVHPTQKSTPERATGRVDITDELHRHILYRLPGDNGGKWVIDDLQSAPKPLDQDNFEQALMRYLR